MLENRLCSQCGTPLPGDSLGGHCLPCLFRLGLTEADDGEWMSHEEETLASELSRVEVEKPGDEIDRYHFVQAIGEGGSGMVYLAEQTHPVRRRVAVKVMKVGLDTKEARARFASEQHALSRMDHPSIAKVFDAGTTKTGRPYLVMELVSGTRMTTHCDENRLSIEQRLQLFTDVCEAIQHAHQKGIIHRDIKPSNVLVTGAERRPMPKVIDFGIAKAIEGRLTDQTLFTAFEGLIGTPAYMSPEQMDMAHMDIDTRSDIYSLGVVLYELLTGKTPFDSVDLVASGLEAMRRTVLQTEPKSPSARLAILPPDQLQDFASRRSLDGAKLIQRLRGDLDWIVMKCLEKDRARRYATASDLAADVQRHLTNDPVLARPSGRVYRLQKLVKRNRVVVGLGCAIAAALVLGLAVSSWLLVRERAAQREQARLRKQAEDSGVLLGRTVDRLELQRAEDLFDSGDAAAALAYLARVLRRNPANPVAAQRLLSALTQRSFPLPTADPLRHANGVSFALFTPDSRRVVTASKDKTARVWDAATGRPLTPPLRHDEAVTFAQLSPDGKWLLTASDDHTARLWDVQTGAPVPHPLRHASSVRFCQFSPDGQRVVTACQDSTARIWAVPTGELLTESISHRFRVWMAQFSPDGRRLITASEDKTAWIWDVETGQRLVGPFAHKAGVRSAQFSPDGKKVVTASDDKTAQIWDALTAAPLAGPLEHKARVWSAQFSPDGQRVVTASDDRTVQIWNAETGRPIEGPMRHRTTVRSAQFSPDGQWIITAWSDNAARIWDGQAGGVSLEPLRHADRVLSGEFSPDVQRVVTASDDKTAQVWDLRMRQPMLAERLGEGEVTCAEMGPTGQRVVLGSNDGTARVWNVQTTQPLTDPLPHGAAVRAVGFSEDGGRVFTVAADGVTRTWNAVTGVLLSRSAGPSAGVVFAALSGDGKRVALGYGGKSICLSDLQAAGRFLWLEHQGIIGSVRFSPDGQKVLTASADETAQIWDAQSGRPLTPPLKHEAGLVSAEFSRDGQKIVTASADETARIWDAKSGRQLTAPLVHEGALLAAAFSADGRRVVTACADGTARVWDRKSAEPLTEPLAHADQVLAVCFSPDGRRIATGSEDKTARVWDVATGQPLTEPLRHRSAVRSVQFTADGERLLTQGADHTVRVWGVPLASVPVPNWVPQLAEAVAAKRCNAEHILESVPFAELRRLRRELAEGKGDGVWDRWATWFFADPGTRTLSPLARTTVPDYIRQRVAENTVDSLQDALELCPTNGLALARFSRALLSQDYVPGAPSFARAEWLSGRALAFAPNEGEAWLSRAAILEARGDWIQAWQALQTALELQPENTELWRMQGNILEKTGSNSESDQSFRNAIDLMRAR